MPSKADKRPGEKALDVYESINPTVVACLSQLTTEVQDLQDWAKSAGVEPDVWGLNGCSYMSDVLRLRNPLRASKSLALAEAAASSETGAKPSNPQPPPEVAERPSSSASTAGFSSAEASAILAKLEAGAIFSGGCRHPVATAPAEQPPPPAASR